MRTARFVIRPHSVNVGEEMVEVFDTAGRFVAAIYTNDIGIKVVSKHYNAINVDRGASPSEVLIVLEEL